MDPIAKQFSQRYLFIVLGKISYAQYLLQYQVWGLLASYDNYTHSNVQRTCFPVALLVAAFLCERFVQRPSTEWQSLCQEHSNRNCSNERSKVAVGANGALEKGSRNSLQQRLL